MFNIFIYITYFITINEAVLALCIQGRFSSLNSLRHETEVGLSSLKHRRTINAKRGMFMPREPGVALDCSPKNTIDSSETRIERYERASGKDEAL